MQRQQHQRPSDQGQNRGGQRGAQQRPRGNERGDQRGGNYGTSAGFSDWDRERANRGEEPIRDDYHASGREDDWNSDLDTDVYGQTRAEEEMGAAGKLDNGYPRGGGRFEQDRWNNRSDSRYRTQNSGQAPYQDRRNDYYSGGSNYGSGPNQYGGSNQWGQSSDYGDSGSYGEFRGNNGSSISSGRGSGQYEQLNFTGANSGGYRGQVQPWQNTGQGHSWQSNGEWRNSGNFNQGQGNQGSHSGKGPKGYQRADERIQEELSERLTEHPQIDASEIEVKVSKGEVTLTGTVHDRQCKRMAEDIAESISGVKDVTNQIRVAQTNGSASNQSGSGQSGSGTNQSSSSHSQNDRELTSSGASSRKNA